MSSLLAPVSTPVRVSVDLTYICDLRCIHCRTNTGEIPPEIIQRMMSLQTIHQLIRDLDEMKTFEITFTGGEPTLHHQFWEIAKLASQLRYASITLITNAAALSFDDIDRIIESGIRSIRISVDGTRETFKEIRKKDVFETVIRNAKYIQSRIPNVKLLTTVMLTNIHNIFELVDYLRQEGFRRMDLILVRAHGRGGRNQLTLSEEQVLDIKRQVEDFRYRVDSFDFELSLNAPYLDAEEWEPVYDVVMYPYLKKDASLAISATGDVTMSRLYSPHPIGNVKYRSIKDIWREGQQSISKDASEFSPELLREIFWNFEKDDENTKDSNYSSLLDRQIFENYKVL